jgi:hypothetical protein
MTDDTYKVGRNRPPRHTQFQKGRSGNPSGRPKGHRNLSSALIAILKENTTVRVDGEPHTMTRLEAAARKLVDKAIDGDARVMAQLLTEIHKHDSKAEKDEAADAFTPADKQVMDALYARLARDAVTKKEKG